MLFADKHVLSNKILASLLTATTTKASISS